MPVVRIIDLAEVMISLLAGKYGFNEKDIKIETIGAKPGEKLYEELMSDDERYRSMELKDMFSVTPAFRGIYQNIEYEYPDMISREIDRPYNSSTENALDKKEVRDYLMEHKVLEKVEEAFFGGM
jgi:FlaA1/EpsC-like NDP-sugar epimerase